AEDWSEANDVGLFGIYGEKMEEREDDGGGG
ncbi:hypothetical protein Tco_1137030, partial [Tanacetum coccineum]